MREKPVRYDAPSVRRVTHPRHTPLDRFTPMRLGVIDVGSNTIHLLVLDAHIGAHPLPASSHKIELRLSEHVDKDGSIARSGADALVAFTKECLVIAEDQGVEDLLAFATSA